MRNLAGQGFHRSFVTLAALSFKGSSVKYVRGGHMPLLKFTQTGLAEYIQPKGMGIGFVGKNIFDNVLEEREIALNRGDLLVLFSDGITEIRNTAGEELGYLRFASIVGAARAETDTQKMIDHILRDVLEYAGVSSFNDDATFVVIKRV
jgi:sigma-B regulation protein RsbU (phosphoserine phosphatase)